MLTIGAEWFPAPTAPDFANEWLRDHFIRLRAESTPDSRIAVVDIDEASLAAIGPWPWPRRRIADMIENLIGTYGVRGVALDLILPEPADEDGDMRLAMLAKHGPVVLAQAFDYATRTSPLRIGKIIGGVPSRTTSNLPLATGFVGNHAGLGGATHAGNIGFLPDDDGTLRRLPMLTSFSGRIYMSLSGTLFECCANGGRKAKIPGDNGVMRVPYSRDWSAYTVISAADIINLATPAATISGRLVIVGSSSLGLSDRVSTPLASSTSGMLVHAAALTTMLDRQAGVEPYNLPGKWIASFYAILIATLAAYTFPRVSAIANLGILTGASLIWLGLAYWVSIHDADFSVTAPLISNLFLLAVAVPFDWQLAQRKSRQLLWTLRQYVAKAVVDELLRLDLKNPLTPRQLNVTTLIADMEGYTTQVESLPVEDAAQLTRDFLACLTRPVLDKHGTIDKFTGDGLVAFWGAPLPVAEHADLALDAAEEIIEEVRRFSLARQQAGKPALRVRIGIESGIAMAGDFGTASRSIYTAVGDSVNVAARLEQMAREFPHDIIIGQGTVDRAIRHRFLLLGEKLLRGREQATTLYTLEPST